LRKNYTQIQNPVETEPVYLNELPENATTATKLQREQKHHFSTGEIEGVIEDYTKNKLTVYQLAEKYGCHRNTVSKLLKNNGVRVTLTRMEEREITEAKRLYESGLSLREIERELGICKTTLGNSLTKAGVTLRPARRYKRSTYQCRRQS
jgi:IS30 family transposase